MSVSPETGLVRELRDAYMREGRLFSAHLDLLYQCDLDCEHCYLDDKATHNQPTAFWLDVVDQLGDMGVFRLTISGGELFVRKDAMAVIERASERGMVLEVKSHGGTITKEMAQALAPLNIASVDVSYYSHRAEIHDTITRRPGSHAATRAGIAVLVEAGVSTRASIIVMERNAADLEETLRDVESMGANPQCTVNMQTAQSGADFPLALGVMPGQMDVSRALLRMDEQAGHCDGSAGDWDTRGICGAGHAAIYIHPEGMVWPCITWAEELGDLSKGDRIEDIWRHSPTLLRIRGYRNGDRATCGSCGLKDGCSYCPGESFQSSGSALEGAPSICDKTYAHASAIARTHGLAPPPEPAGHGGNPFRVLLPAAQRL
jgi:radical SAM protein with 4Fe4S-binding SPASM domain